MFFCSQYWPILPIYVYVYFLLCDACRLLFVHLYCNRFKVTAPVFEKSLVLKEINVTFLYSLLTQCKKVQVIVLCLSVCLYVSHFTRILLPYTMAPLKAAPSTPHPPPPPPPPRPPTGTATGVVAKILQNGTFMAFTSVAVLSYSWGNKTLSQLWRQYQSDL